MNSSFLQIIPVESKQDLKSFINLPWTIYNKKVYPQWVPPLKLAVKDSLDIQKNPFYKEADIQLFLARKGQQVVGRIAAIENRAHNRFYHDKVGFYGFFESIDDQAVANLLFDQAAAWVRNRGLEFIRGPVNPSTNHEAGLLVRGQSQHPTVMTTWNPKYYVDLHETAGLQKSKDMVAYFIPVERIAALPDRVLEHAEKIRESSNITFREFDKKNFQRDVDICFNIYNKAWEENWGFVPSSQEEFRYMAKDLKMVLDPHWCLIAEQQGKPAAFMLALPDINYILKRIPNGRLLPTGILKLFLGRSFLKTVRIITLGVMPEFRKSGIFSLFTLEAFQRAKKYGVIGGEASWILEDNEAMNRPWQEIGAPLYRRWRLYQRKI